MRRGGDTPGTQTLFALEIESGRFISFYFQDGVLYANTDDGSSALWVLDSNGIVIDNISYSIADRAPILAQINEHYGTSFSGWSDNEISLSLGDTLPSWNEYEKIRLSLAEGLYKFDVSQGYGSAYAAMKFQNGTMQIYSGETAYGLRIIIYNPQGVYQGPGGEDSILNAVQQICANYSNVQSVEKVLKDTNNLENFENYTLLS